VVHALATQTDAPGQVGFVVGRRVAGAVGRNRVRRRLRHLAAAHVDDLSAGMIVVVRATASAVDDAALADDFETSWSAALRAATRREAEAPMVAVAGDRRLTSDLVGYVETVRVAA
jgi:ribonuclease P protein component